MGDGCVFVIEGGGGGGGGYISVGCMGEIEGRMHMG